MSSSRRNSLRRNSLRSNSLSGAQSEMSIFKEFQNPIKIDIKTVDMEPQLQDMVENITREAIESSTSEKDIAATVRKDLDKIIGKTWNVIVGKHFGSEVTHESKKYIHMQYGDINILVWKSG